MDFELHRSCAGPQLQQDKARSMSRPLVLAAAAESHHGKVVSRS